MHCYRNCYNDSVSWSQIYLLLCQCKYLIQFFKKKNEILLICWFWKGENPFIFINTRIHLSYVCINTSTCTHLMSVLLKIFLSQKKSSNSENFRWKYFKLKENTVRFSTSIEIVVKFVQKFYRFNFSIDFISKTFSISKFQLVFG